MDVDYAFCLTENEKKLFFIFSETVVFLYKSYTIKSQ